MVGRATVAAHLDISTVALRRLVEMKVVDDAAPGEMDLDAARVSYIRHLRAGASGRGGDSLAFMSALDCACAQFDVSAAALNKSSVKWNAIVKPGTK